MNKAFTKASIQTGAAIIMESLQMDHGDPVSKAVIECVYRNAMRDHQDQTGDEQAELSAKTDCLISLQNRYEALIEFEQDFFDIVDVPYDRKAMIVAILCHDRLDKISNHPADFKAIKALAPNLLEKALVIKNTADAYLREGDKEQENESAEALFCTMVTFLDKMQSFDLEIDTDEKEYTPIKFYAEEIFEPAKHYIDTDFAIGKQLHREHEVLKAKILRKEMPRFKAFLRDNPELA